LAQNTLEEADSAVQDRIVDFTRASTLCYPGEPNAIIPTGLIVAGPSIASHGPFFERLGRKIKNEDRCGTYVLLTSEECPNLKTLLKNLIKKVTSQVEDDEDEEHNRPTTSARHGPRLLNYDLGHILEWQHKNNANSIVVAFQDSEAFETGLLTDTIDLLQ
jgi:origin recognition complex subunit 3